MTDKEKIYIIQNILNKAWEILNFEATPLAMLGVLTSIEAIVNTEDE